MTDYRLLKFDVVHPQDYLHRKHAEWDDLDDLTRREYLHRVNRLRSNYSDYYTYHLDDEVWTAEEFYLLDPVYLRKVAHELYGASYWGHRVIGGLKDRPRQLARRLLRAVQGDFSTLQAGWERYVVKDYIRGFQPDVLFVRSNTLPSSFWQQFRDECLLVTRLSARMPEGWHPEHFDVIYTDNPTFQKFFEAHDVPTYLNKQGFDERILDEVDDQGTSRNVTFVGGLGKYNFGRRTRLMEAVAREVPSFRWWGYWWPSWEDTEPTDDFPNLQRTFQGPTSGIDMFQIYRDSKIVLNDYVDIDVDSGIGFNQRIFEVLGIGSFMLTREATNFEDDTPGRLFATFENTDDCLQQIEYYLAHPDEREEIAQAGQEHVLEHFNYRDIVAGFDHTLRAHLDDERE